MIEDDTEEGMLEIRKEEAAIEQQIADLYRAIQYRKGY
tara:strand:+ start:518 stop:631 length:114 start_codon:yes stop_codon:yes gene_type:complete